MTETIIVILIIGGVVFLVGRSLYRNIAGKENSRACGVKVCSSSGCCNQIMEKMNEE